MNSDDIIRMAVECHLMDTGNRDGIYAKALVRFAELVAAAERRECRVYLDDDFYIAAGTDHDKLWLGRLSGEGGDFDKETIREMLVKFYEENL